jgi:hypothetical protein
MKNIKEKISGEHVKVLFELEQVDGYPPFGVESVWAIKLSDGLFKIDNIPFYVRGIAMDDVVRAIPADALGFRFNALVNASGHSTIRVVFFESAIRDTFIRAIESLGCKWEGAYEPSLVAIDIPPAADLKKVLILLSDSFDRGEIDYEEGVLR